MDPVHESGTWTWSKVEVHGPLVHVLSSPSHDCSVKTYFTMVIMVMLKLTVILLY